jgi:hypothetical protein
LKRSATISGAWFGSITPPGCTAIGPANKNSRRLGAGYAKLPVKLLAR